MLKKILPNQLRLLLRVIEHNIRYSNASLYTSLRLGLEQVGILDHKDTHIFMPISVYEELGHLRSCKREPETVQWINEYIKPTDVVYDVGANVGVFSLIIAKKQHAKNVIYAFEPSFSTYSSISKNIAYNKASDNIKPLQIALADETKIQYFKYANIAPGHAHHALEANEHTMSRINSVHTQAVVAYKLDDFVAQFNIAFPTHIKIDVDGEEEKVLRGSYHILRSPELKTILIEVDENLENHTTLVQLITDAGFILEQKIPKKSSQMFTCIFKK